MQLQKPMPQWTRLLKTPKKAITTLWKKQKSTNKSQRIKKPALTAGFSFFAFGILSLERNYRYIRFVVSFFLELNNSIHFSVKGVIFTHVHVGTWIVF